MLKFLVAFIIVTCAESWVFGQTPVLLGQASPKLQVFIKGHPGASKILTINAHKAFENRKILLCYFYNKSEDARRASSHSYSELGEVWLQIQENQEPLDEYFSILHECLNAINESKFNTMVEQAKQGTIPRSKFSQTTFEMEFQQALAERNLIMSLKLNENEKRQSCCYPKIQICPDTLEEYRKYLLKFGLDRIKEYEKYYDELKKTQATN